MHVRSRASVSSLFGCQALAVEAEEEGFEPPASFDAAGFKTAAFSRSATPPGARRGYIAQPAGLVKKKGAARARRLAVRWFDSDVAPAEDPRPPARDMLASLRTAGDPPE